MSEMAKKRNMRRSARLAARRRSCRARRRRPKRSISRARRATGRGEARLARARVRAVARLSAPIATTAIGARIPAESIGAGAFLLLPHRARASGRARVRRKTARRRLLKSSVLCARDDTLERLARPRPSGRSFDQSGSLRRHAPQRSTRLQLDGAPCSQLADANAVRRAQTARSRLLRAARAVRRPPPTRRSNASVATDCMSKYCVGRRRHRLRRVMAIGAATQRRRRNARTRATVAGVALIRLRAAQRVFAAAVAAAALARSRALSPSCSMKSERAIGAVLKRVNCAARRRCRQQRRRRRR